MSPLFTHYFTPKEANRRLPLIRKIVEDILVSGRELKDELLQLKEGDEIPDSCLKKKDTIEDLMRELEDLGCFFKDWSFEVGLVDFPSRIHGQEVLLCWRTDEPEVRFYHGVDEGFANRKPIPEELFIA